jgi:hypothetical protein
MPTVTQTHGTTAAVPGRDTSGFSAAIVAVMTTTTHDVDVEHEDVIHQDHDDQDRQ